MLGEVQPSFAEVQGVVLQNPSSTMEAWACFGQLVAWTLVDALAEVATSFVDLAVVWLASLLGGH